jgi:peroxiredoxin
MSFDDELNNKRAGNGRNPLLIIGGFIILGVALVLLIFGGGLFGGAGTVSDTPVLEQIPALEAADSNTIQLPSGGGGPLEVGALAYDFSLNDVDGNPIQLSELAGRPIIINFWATWCAPCRIEMPELEAAYQAYQEDGLMLLALNQKEPADIVSIFFGELGLNFTPVLDSEGSVSELYGVANILPTTFFINEKGEITAIHRGPMVQSQIDGYLADTIPTTN